MWPVVGTGNDRVEVAHHLAAIANAESESIGTGEEAGEFGAGAFVEKDALGPAFAGTENVAVAKATAGDEATEVFERNAARQDVSHVDIDGLKPCTVEGGGHFDLTVNTLLAQDGHRWAVFCDRRRGDVESDLGGDAWIGSVEFKLVFRLSAGRVIAKCGDAAGGIGPDGAQRGKVVVEQNLAGLTDDEAVIAVECADARSAGFEAVAAQESGDVVEVGFAHLNDCTKFLREHKPIVYS